MARNVTTGRTTCFAALAAAVLFALAASPGVAQDAVVSDAVPSLPAGAAADAIADVFSKVGDQLYEDCIFELSEEQVAIQAALVLSYVERGATGQVARRLAATQIQPPKLPEQCEQMRRMTEVEAPDW